MGTDGQREGNKRTTASMKKGGGNGIRKKGNQSTFMRIGPTRQRSEKTRSGKVSQGKNFSGLKLKN